MQKIYKMHGMGLRTVVKLGTFVSVVLFCMAVGYYAFMQLDTAERNRDVDFFSLIPQSSISVLESPNISAFMNELPMLNYAEEIEKLQSSSLFSFLLNGFNEYATTNAHGLSSEMSKIAVSFHAPFTPLDQVVYFGMGSADEKMLEAMLHEYSSTNFLPKEEKYRGKSILVYPLGTDEYLASYSESGFLVISLQKRLIEQVIDAIQDETSLKDDEVFASLLQHKKTYGFLTLYSRSSAMPFLQMGERCWSEYDFHANSDVLYLTGETYMPDTCTCLNTLWEERLDSTYYEPYKVLFSTNKDSVAYYIDQAFETEEPFVRNLFNQCVANLSKETAYTLVVDMQEAADYPERFAAHMPQYLQAKAPLLSPFIFSAQYVWNGDNRLSHIWTFTYKD